MAAVAAAQPALLLADVPPSLVHSQDVRTIYTFFTPILTVMSALTLNSFKFGSRQVWDVPGPHRNHQRSAVQGGRMRAWRHGVPTDSEAAFRARLRHLLAYSAQHGDTHVGFRSTDDPGLARWTAAQRAGFAEGTLTADRCIAVYLCSAH